MTAQYDAGYIRRSNGQERNGLVHLEDFDRGIVETLGATPFLIPGSQDDYGYYWVLPTVKPPPGMPGVPILFGDGEDVFEKYKVPYILVSPAAPQAAMHRWHPTTTEYRAPAATAREVQVGRSRGFDRYEEKQQAHPFDFTYVLRAMTTRRARPAPGRGAGFPAVPVVEGGSSNALLEAILRVYPAYCGVNVRDTAGDVRTYSAFLESIEKANEATSVGDRILGYAVTVRVEGEWDLTDAEVHSAVRRLTVRAETL